ncbi:hypothetical protein J0S82_019746, partial [Galemys pyrenaicus]
MKTQKPSGTQSRSCHSPRLRQGLEQNLTVMNQFQNSRNRIPHRQPHKPSWRQQLKLMKNQGGKDQGLSQQHSKKLLSKSKETKQTPTVQEINEEVE